MVAELNYLGDYYAKKKNQQKTKKKQQTYHLPELTADFFHCHISSRNKYALSKIAFF